MAKNPCLSLPPLDEGSALPEAACYIGLSLSEPGMLLEFIQFSDPRYWYFAAFGRSEINFTKRPMHFDHIVDAARQYVPTFDQYRFYARPDHKPAETTPWDRPATKPKRFVYFISASGFSMVKIGVAQSPDSRLQSLQTGSPVPLTLLGQLSGGSTLERELHTRFAKLRSHGEWFHDRGELADFISAQFDGAKTP